MTRRRRATPRPPAPPTVTREEIYEAAEVLLCELAVHVGDVDSVDRTLREWVDAEDDFRQCAWVALAALRTVFATCLTPVPTHEVPPGALTFDPTPDERQTV